MIRFTVRLVGCLIIVAALWFRIIPDTQDDPVMPLKEPEVSAQSILSDQVSIQLVAIQLPDVPVSTDRDIQTAADARQYEIAFNWPERRPARINLHKVLHQCFGVQLAKVNESGEVLVIEQPGSEPLAGMSPYVRLYQDDITLRDQQLVATWRHIKGKVVRFYPAWIDDQLFSEINALTPVGSQGQVQIRGTMSTRSGSLVISQLTINGHRVDRIITISRPASHSSHC